MRFPGLAHLLTLTTFVVIPQLARADRTLVLDLPPSESQQDAAGIAEQLTSKEKPAADRSAKDFSRFNNSHRASTPNRSSGAVRGKEKVIGRLGIAGRTTRIYTRQGNRRRTLARVNAGTYLALTGSAGDWLGVLMADHTTGWIDKRDVKVLDYEVVGPDTPHRSAADYADYASRGGSALLSGGQQSILSEAYKYLGVPYRYGGTSPNGLDCSAFVQHCFGTLGVQLPRTAAEQSACGAPVSTEQLQAADRLYFASRDGRITHTGIYIGNGYFIHASSSRGGVAVSRLNEPLYSRMYAGARR